MTTHKHRAVPRLRRTTPFFGAVRSRPNPKAHGSICHVDHCSCGATRKTNYNAGALEMGAWR